MKLTTFEKLPLYLAAFHIFSQLFSMVLLYIEQEVIRTGFYVVAFSAISLPIGFILLIRKNKHIIGLTVAAIGYYGFAIFGTIATVVSRINFYLDGYVEHSLITIGKLASYLILYVVLIIFLFKLLRKVNNYHEESS